MADPNVDAVSVLELFGEICDRTAEIVGGTIDWGETGRRAGQYLVDVDTDAACTSALLAAGYSVLSEESGIQHPPASGGGIVIVDPLDGSTNASLGLPWCATSLCLVHEGVAAVAMVSNLATGTRFSAVRGGGAWRDGRPIAVAEPVSLDEAIVAISGLPSHDYGWRQFRAMGAVALDVCAVAGGAFDGFVDMSVDAHGVWDYAGAMLIVEEAGGVVFDAFDRDLLVVDTALRRTPVVASDRALATVLADQRRARAAQA